MQNIDRIFCTIRNNEPGDVAKKMFLHVLKDVHVQTHRYRHKKTIKIKAKYTKIYRSRREIKCKQC